MLAMILSILPLASAAPVRGSTMVALPLGNVSFTLGGTTLNLVSTGTLGNCSNQLVSIREVQETTRYDAFPSDSRAQFLQVRTPIAIHQMNQNQLHTGCPYGVERRPSTGFRFLSNSASPWVAWNDTILAKDTLQTGSGWVRQLKDIRIHWVWSAYDSTRPWVRWTDTLDQAPAWGLPC